MNNYKMPQSHISTIFHRFALVILKRTPSASLSLGIEVLTSSGFVDSKGGLFPFPLSPHLYWRKEFLKARHLL